jgi:Zn-finger nucleic acid-binding protein
MVKFKLTCPMCGAVTITASPNAVIWDKCPGCKSHVWDEYDVLMADVWRNPAESRHAAVGIGN